MFLWKFFNNKVLHYFNVKISVYLKTYFFYNSQRSFISSFTTLNFTVSGDRGSFFFDNPIRFVFYKTFFKNLFLNRKLKKKKNIKNVPASFKKTHFPFLENSFNVFKLLIKKINLNLNVEFLNIPFLFIYNKSFGEGFNYIRGLFIVFFIDSMFIDDEPLWEPLEWSLVQTWLLFIFIIAWIAENLITSRFGSYTGRDKRVWFAWYKTFWLIELWYALSYGAACMFVIVPFYYEITYSMSFIFSWWNWCNRVFFFKFIFVYSIIILIGTIFQLSIKWLSWKKQFLLILFINFFFLYLLYTQFVISFFAYFNDPIWYQKTKIVDYVQLSHEPLKWGWGPSKRDHFSYHKTSTVFWFKNDGPFAAAFLMINLFFFLSIFFTFFYFLILLRKIYTTRESSFTFSTFCVSSLKQFFYLFLLLYILILISFLIQYWRFPIEFIWINFSNSWFIHFFFILIDYFKFL